MHVQIVSKGIDVSPALRERISDRLEEMADKYFQRDGEANVSVAREGGGFRGTVALHLASGASLQAHGEAPDAYAATDEALEHLAKRLRRYKRRLKAHKHEDRAESFAMTILQNPVGVEDDADTDAPAPVDEPAIIAEKHGKVRALTPAMAALECAMADGGVVVFRNPRHGRVNVCFKRADGHIGWVDPPA